MLNEFPLFSLIPKPPALPKSLRYWDDFGEKFHTIDDLESDTWEVFFDGTSARLTLPVLPQSQRLFLRAVTADLIVSRSVKTATSYVSALRSVDTALLGEIIQSIGTDEPSTFSGKWTARYRGALERHSARTIRYVLHCACKWSYGAWREADAALVRALPGYTLNKYKAAQEGSCFVPPVAQSQIVDFIDEIAQRARRREVSSAELHLGAILALSFQYGLRRGQIARLGVDDVVRYDAQTIHIRIRLLKQRGQTRARTVVRSVQVGWTPIFLELLRDGSNGPAEKFFGRTPKEIGDLVKALADELTGSAYSTSDFRHTAAQRLVDSGASREEVTDFLGHSDHTAADVYFAASPKQADLVDAALGKSAVYGRIAEVARTKSISVTDLVSRPDDEQVAGMPHGIPISGHRRLHGRPVALPAKSYCGLLHLPQVSGRRRSFGTPTGSGRPSKRRRPVRSAYAYRPGVTGDASAPNDIGGRFGARQPFS